MSLCIFVCVCVCTHSLLPPFSLVLERLLLRPPPWVRVSCPKILHGSSWIGAAWYYSVKSSCQRDMNVWLLWTGNKKTTSSCVTARTTNIIAENVISTGTLLHLDLGWREEGHFGARIWHLQTFCCQAFRECLFSHLSTISGAEKVAGVTHYRQFSLWGY